VAPRSAESTGISHTDRDEALPRRILTLSWPTNGEPSVHIANFFEPRSVLASKLRVFSSEKRRTTYGLSPPSSINQT